MFIACVVKPGRMIETMALEAALLEDPEYDDAGMLISKEAPPYETVDGIPDGAGRVDEEKYIG